MVVIATEEEACADRRGSNSESSDALTAVTADMKTGKTEHIGEDLVFWGGTSPPPHVNKHEWAALDPRIRYRPATKEYYLTWDNCTFECGFRTSLLSISKNPFDSHSWEFVGPVINGMQTAGVSLLFQDEQPESKHPGSSPDESESQSAEE